MRRLTVRDVMTTDVAVVRESAPFKEVARLLQHRRVSALPVLDDQGRVAGVVSEADLILDHEQRQERRRLGPIRRRRGARTMGDTVAGAVMTSPALTIGPDALLTEAARVMTHRRVKRLPVVDARGRLVGIVSRADLISVLVRADDEIERVVRHEVSSRVLLTEIGTIRVHVEEGVVPLTGDLDRRSSVQLAEFVVRTIDGVVDVVNQLTYRHDDTEVPMARFTGV